MNILREAFQGVAMLTVLVLAALAWPANLALAHGGGGGGGGHGGGGGGHGSSGGSHSSSSASHSSGGGHVGGAQGSVGAAHPSSITGGNVGHPSSSVVPVAPQAGYAQGYSGGGVNGGHVGGLVAPSHARAQGHGFGLLGFGIGGVGYGYCNGGYNSSSGGYASVACYITDPVTGFVYYCPYGLAGWAGWGSGWLPYGAYRVL